MDNHQMLWDKILQKLNNDLGDQAFNQIFKDCDTIHKFENNYLYIIVPSTLIKFRIEQFFLNKINYGDFIFMLLFN